MRTPLPRGAGHPDLVCTLISSVLVGAASGLRSQMGVAAVVLRAEKDGLPPVLRTTAAARTVVAAAAGELVVDKSPRAVSRLRPGPLAARIVLGAIAGGLLAATKKGPVVPAAAVASAAAVLAAKVGHDLRARAARSVPDRAVAVVEDGVALGLAAAGTRPASPR
ncbi:MAG TPA: hypothetical protein VHY77_09770 [Acidimicrobiales bacterium]|nr:hypothetical protein [Acidimicrobiales bacterium]